MNWERTTPVIGNKKADKKKKNGLNITNKKKAQKVVDEKVEDVCSGNLSSSWDAVARQKDSEQLEIDKRLLEEHPKFNDPYYWSS